MLLGMKSAVNFLRFHSGLRILPSCPPIEDVDSVDASSSYDSTTSLELSDQVDLDFSPVGNHHNHFLPVDAPSVSVPSVIAVTPDSELENDEFSEDEQ